MSEARELYNKWNPEVNQSNAEDIQLILALEGELQILERQNKELRDLLQDIEKNGYDLRSDTIHLKVKIALENISNYLTGTGEER